MNDYGDVTRILGRLSEGDAEAFDRLLPLVYEELRALAGNYMRQERGGHTLQATALTHECYLRLRGKAQVSWQNRAHFLAVAAQAMRRILVDHARGKRRKKRGGDLERTGLDQIAAPGGGPDLDLLALDDALGKLAETEPRKCRVVELLYFGGLTGAEAAEVIGVTSRTVERDWQFARAWLLREIGR